MINYKHLIIGSVAALILIGCGETSLSSTTQDTELRENLSVRMMDIGQNLSNEEVVKKDYEALTMPKYINKDHALPSEGITGSDINWTLLNSGDFNITSHTLMIEDTSKKHYVKLSAFINYDLNSSTLEANKTKEFCTTVLPKVTDACDKVNQDITMISGNLFPLTIDLNSTEPYANCGLRKLGSNDSNITWKVCDALLEINEVNELRVKDPLEITGQTCTTVKGTFQHGDIVKDAYFKVIILPLHKMMRYEEACALVKVALETLEDNTFDINSALPLSDGDVTIDWISCKPELLTIDEEGNFTNHNTSGEAKTVSIKTVLSLQGIEKKLCIQIEVPTI